MFLEMELSWKAGLSSDRCCVKEILRPAEKS